MAINTVLQPYFYLNHAHQSLLRDDQYHSLVMARTAGEGYHYLAMLARQSTLPAATGDATTATTTISAADTVDAVDANAAPLPSSSSSSSPLPDGAPIMLDAEDYMMQRWQSLHEDDWNGSDELQALFDIVSYYSQVTMDAIAALRTDTVANTVSFISKDGNRLDDHAGVLFPFTLRRAAAPLPSSDPKVSTFEEWYPAYERLIDGLTIDRDCMLVEPLGVPERDWDAALRYCATAADSYTMAVKDNLTTDDDATLQLPIDIVPIVLLYLVPLIQIGRYFETAAYTYSSTIPRNMSAALKAYQLAMLHDKHPMAAAKCGYIHLQGCNATKVNWRLARYCFRYATLLGSDEGMYGLSTMYTNQCGVVPKNWSTEREALALIVSSRCPHAWFQLARRLLNGTAHGEWMMDDSSSSSSSASTTTRVDKRIMQHKVGGCLRDVAMTTLIGVRMMRCEWRDTLLMGLAYYNGTADLPQSQTMALTTFQLMVICYGLCQAQLMVAFWYRDQKLHTPTDTRGGGSVGVIDPVLQWYRVVANQGSPDGMNEMAHYLETSCESNVAKLAMVKDEVLALYRCAAQVHGMPMAMRNLGRICYDDTFGVAPPLPQDLIEARRWLVHAATLGDEDSAAFVPTVEDELQRVAPTDVYQRTIDELPAPEMKPQYHHVKTDDDDSDNEPM